MNRIVLTGASDGIGLHLARLLDTTDNSLLLVARRIGTLEGFALNPRHRYVQADLSEPDGVRAVEEAIEELGWLDVNMFIHNAAAATVGNVAGQSVDSVEEMLQVNFISAMGLSHMLVPRMVSCGGKLVFIGSVVTGSACPGFAVYTATKSALSGFARSLRLELHGEITVQVIHPSATKTGMHEKAGMKPTFFQRYFMSPEYAAQAIVQALQSNKPEVTIGLLLSWVNRAILLSTKLFSILVSPHSSQQKTKSSSFMEGSE